MYRGDNRDNNGNNNNDINSIPEYLCAALQTQGHVHRQHRNAIKYTDKNNIRAKYRKLVINSRT